MSTRKTKFLIWFTVLVLVMACVPTLAAPLPTADPNLINTFIAQTANVAASKTAAALPTNTFTETPSPTPENTQTASPTPTSTVIFLLSSPTKLVIPTFTSISSGGSGGVSGGSTSSDDLACQVISVNPANGTSFNSRTSFDASWRVKNIGQKNWDRNSVDVVYDSGAKMHQIAGYDLDATVKVGDTINFTVNMEAPKASGSYTTVWVLRASAKVFCKMSLSINVR